MKCSLLGVAGAFAAALVIATSARSGRADTLLYSFETLYNDSDVADPSGTRPDGYHFNGGGVVTQDTFGATDGTHSMKYALALADTFTGAITAVGVPFPDINSTSTTAVSLDLTIKAGDEFTGGFANLGITEFGTYHDPDLGDLTGQGQTVASAEQNLKLAAGTYRIVVPLIARVNPNSFQSNTPFSSEFGADPGGTLTPVGFQFYINKGATTGTGSLPNAPFTVYIDNVRAVTNRISSWKSDANGNWSGGSNWQGLPTATPTSTVGIPPNGVDAIAEFGIGGPITAPRTITVDTPQTIGTAFFNNGNSYSIVGTSTLTFDVSAGQAGINVYYGAHSIAAPVVLNDDMTINVSGGTGSLTVGPNLTATGKTITKTGIGPVQFENVRAGGLNVSAGSVNISAKGSANSPDGTSVVQSLSIASGATMNLSNNSMVIDYSGPVGTLVDDTRLMLKNNQLTSSSADANHRLGYLDNATLGLATFSGQSVDSSSILIKFTFGGDANLDGQVDVTDLGALATNWQTSNVWAGGDFNYDGFVDVTDLGILATDWQLGVGSPLGPDSLQAALESVGLGNVGVPEPSGIGMLTLGVIGFLSRRRLRLRRDPING